MDTNVERSWIATEAATTTDTETYTETFPDTAAETEPTPRQRRIQTVLTWK